MFVHRIGRDGGPNSGWSRSKRPTYGTHPVFAPACQASFPVGRCDPKRLATIDALYFS